MDDKTREENLKTAALLDFIATCLNTSDPTGELRAMARELREKAQRV